ncbi:MAG: TIM barrel protein [Clostridia bacterium]|nr:TIM barrel protein [Clostridia bacterium]
MAEFVLSAFADEAGRSLEEQICALRENGISYIEPRNIGGKGILTLTEDELCDVKRELDKNGIKVNSLGSPIGKYPIEKPLSEHLPDLERALRACEILDTKNIRMFSFYIPKDKCATDYTDEVISRLKTMSEIATARGIQLCHENEKGIFGQNPEEVNTLTENVPGLKFIFDGANYRECDCDTIEGINTTLKSFAYMHIKDAIYSPHMIVPAGEGEAKLDEVIEKVNASVDGMVYLTLEPHLHIFDAFKDIDDTELNGKYVFKSNREAFDFAVAALKKLLTKLGYKETLGVWKK